MNHKYTKPITKDLAGVSITSGSCFSGLDERDVTGACNPGGDAIGGCGAGATVFPVNPCSQGNFAGLSCYTGILAG